MGSSDVIASLRLCTGCYRGWLGAGEEAGLAVPS